MAKDPAKAGTDGKVREWLKLRREIADAETRKKELQSFVEQLLEKSPDKSRKFDDVTLTLAEVTQKRFDVERAEETLGTAALAPFYKESTHKRINVKI